MQEKKLSPLMICHLLVMAALVLLNLISAAMMIASLFSTQGVSAETVLGIAAMMLSAAALAFGILYLANGYSKAAANFYQAFLLLTLCAALLSALTNVMGSGFGAPAVLAVIKLFVLFTLAVWKDLGKWMTWILFYVLLGVDIAAAIVTGIPMGVLGTITAIASALLIDGTIGLFIRGKYADKEARYFAR